MRSASEWIEEERAWSERAGARVRELFDLLDAHMDGDVCAHPDADAWLAEIRAVTAELHRRADLLRRFVEAAESGKPFSPPPAQENN